MLERYSLNIAVSETSHRIWKFTKKFVFVSYVPVFVFQETGSVHELSFSMWSVRYYHTQRITLQHRLRLLVFRRCSKKIRSHPRRTVERTTSPWTEKKTGKIRCDCEGERPRGEKMTISSISAPKSVRGSGREYRASDHSYISAHDSTKRGSVGSRERAYGAVPLSINVTPK